MAAASVLAPPWSAPLERFLALDALLERQERHWLLCYPEWLGFAAVMAGGGGGDPALLAARIAAQAAGLKAHSGWLDPLHAPLRFLIAAALVRAGLDRPQAAAALAMWRAAVRAAGLRHAGHHEVLAALLLLLDAGGGTPEPGPVERLRDLHRALSGHHWWTRGAHDLPGCALLARLPGGAHDIAAAVDGCQRALAGLGLWRGARRELTAHILSLAPFPVSEALARFAALRRLVHHGGPLRGWQDDEALALLALAGGAPDEAAALVGAIAADLERRRPGLVPEAALDIAADLALPLLAGEGAVAGLGWRCGLLVAAEGALAMDPDR